MKRFKFTPTNTFILLLIGLSSTLAIQNVSMLSRVKPMVKNGQGKEILKYDQIDSCAPSQCLFQYGDTVEGLGILRGFYRNYESTEDNEKVFCHGFVVKEGSQPLIDNFLSWISKGNTVNKLTDSGELLINIDFRDVDARTRDRVLTSNENRQVELDVVRFTPSGSGASTCASFISIISTN